MQQKRTTRAGKEEGEAEEQEEDEGKKKQKFNLHTVTNSYQPRGKMSWKGTST